MLALNDSVGRALVELSTSGTYEGLLRQQSWSLKAAVRELHMVDKVAAAASPFATVLHFVVASSDGSSGGGATRGVEVSLFYLPLHFLTNPANDLT